MVYDFDLLSPPRTNKLADIRLDRPTHVVCDTETTGLNPRQGDEIVQLAAVRIVNGRRVEGPLGLSFDMPRCWRVLVRVLLSAVVYGQLWVHSLDALSHWLDALSHWLGITIPEEDRHTAISDTIATAVAFRKLTPMLAGRRVDSFGAVLTEVRKHGWLLKDLN